MKPLFVRFIERQLVGRNTQDNRVEWVNNNKRIIAYVLWRTIKRDFTK